MTPCPPAEVLERLLGNGLSPAEDAAASAHVQGCPSCQQELERLTGGVSFPDGRSLPLARARDAQAVHPGLLPRVLRLSPTPAVSGETPPTAPAGPDGGPAPRIPGYEVVAELGRGGMGVVYKARETALGRFVALKMLLAGAEARGEQVARFRREAEVIAALRHPNVVQIHAVGEHDGRLFFTMEYVPGGNLARHLGGAPQDPRGAAALVQALAGAVQAAHRAGVVHRDLKPANVLLAFSRDPQGSASGPALPCGSRLNEAVPKLTDFGLAKRLGPAGADALSRSGPVVGSPSYMAPEQARGRPGGVGPAADVYALGAILYECLTGRPPFRAATPVDTVLQVLHDEPVPPRRLQPTVPRDLETVCLHCLRKEPAGRYPSAAALAEDLRRFLAGEPVRARPAGVWGRGVKWVRRRPALAALLAVSAAAVLAVALLSVWYNLRLTAEVREARRQRQRADGNLREALAVVDGMLGALRDPRTGGVVELDEPRRRQLDHAARFYQGLLAEPDNGTAEARRLSGLAHYNLGRIAFLTGDKGQAARRFREAAALQQALADEFPGERGHREALAKTFSDLANNSPEADEADDWYRKALGLLAGLAREDPEGLSFLRVQAAVHNNRFMLFQSRRQRDRAEAALREALPLAEGLVRRAPKDLDARITLSHACTRLGLVSAQAGQWDGARAYLKRSLAALEPHARDQARDRHFALALAQTYNLLAFVAQQTGRPAERLDWCGRMIRALEGALRPSPRDRQVRRLLAEAHGGRGIALNNLGKYAEAAPDLDRLVELSDGPERVRYRALRALNRASARDHAAACAEAQELAALAGSDGPLLYDLVRVHCFAVNGARQDERLTAEAREQLAEKYARQAVALLAKAQAAGFFRDPGRAQLLREGADLRPLRGREDFRRLLRSAVGGSP